MSSFQNTVHNQSFRSIALGVLYAFVSMGIITVIVSLLLLFTSMKEQSLSFYIYIIHGIALIIGGIITGKRIERKGWYYGGMMGLIYSIVIMLIGFLGFDASFNLATVSLIVLSFSSGALGGMIGVNMKGR